MSEPRLPGFKAIYALEPQQSRYHSGGGTAGFAKAHGDAIIPQQPYAAAFPPDWIVLGGYPTEILACSPCRAKGRMQCCYFNLAGVTTAMPSYCWWQRCPPHWPAGPGPGPTG
jgi:hypothetical protein